MHPVTSVAINIPWPHIKQSHEIAGSFRSTSLASPAWRNFETGRIVDRQEQQISGKNTIWTSGNQFPIYNLAMNRTNNIVKCCTLPGVTRIPQHLPRSFNVKFRESEIEIDKDRASQQRLQFGFRRQHSMSGIGRAAVTRTVQKKSVRARKY